MHSQPTPNPKSITSEEDALFPICRDYNGLKICTLTVSVRSWRSALSSARPLSLVRPGKSVLFSSQFVKATFAYDMGRYSVIEKAEVKILKLKKNKPRLSKLQKGKVGEVREKRSGKRIEVEINVNRRA